MRELSAQQLEEVRLRLEARASRLAKEEELLRRRHENLLDSITQQAIMLVLLRKMRERNWLKPSDLREIEHARDLQAGDDYRPRERLASILRETVLDRELKRKTPQ